MGRKEQSEFKCHTCKKSFNTKDEMMTHRLKDHSLRVKPCREGTNCTRTKCWYNHEVDTPLNVVGAENTPDGWVSDELDNENEDFHQPPQPEKPPAQNQ